MSTFRSQVGERWLEEAPGTFQSERQLGLRVRGQDEDHRAFMKSGTRWHAIQSIVPLTFILPYAYNGETRVPTRAKIVGLGMCQTRMAVQSTGAGIRYVTAEDGLDFIHAASRFTCGYVMAS
jgi:hypothetical protein